MILHGKLIRVLAFIVALLPGICLAQAPEFEDWNAKYQATYVWQGKRSFSAAYSGANSLSIDREKSYSFTATAAFGFRPWTGGELYFNPEAAQGIRPERQGVRAGVVRYRFTRSSTKAANPTCVTNALRSSPI